mmetsp:Transcript_86663/g.187490  ORF Transcript_86663/g.187490 Transcript_86663/m.187490 type:complete len:89 (-) Transcript_86663:318-584(-)
MVCGVQDETVARAWSICVEAATLIWVTPPCITSPLLPMGTGGIMFVATGTAAPYISMVCGIATEPPACEIWTEAAIERGASVTMGAVT